MSITLSSIELHRGMRWSGIKGQFVAWRRRARSRSELQYLSDQALRDIGISRCDVHREVAKPFWMA